MVLQFRRKGPGLPAARAAWGRGRHRWAGRPALGSEFWPRRPTGFAFQGQRHFHVLQEFVCSALGFDMLDPLLDRCMRTFLG